jgi:hypothetical protein
LTNDNKKKIEGICDMQHPTALVKSHSAAAQNRAPQIVCERMAQNRMIFTFFQCLAQYKVSGYMQRYPMIPITLLTIHQYARQPPKVVSRVSMGHWSKPIDATSDAWTGAVILSEQ